MKFKPEDFKEVMVYHSSGMCGNIEPVQCVELAELCNARLAEMLKEAPEVSGYIHDDGYILMDSQKDAGKFKARLVCIEPIGEGEE